MPAIFADTTSFKIIQNRRKVLVTGATGLLGREIVRQLLEGAYEVQALFRQHPARKSPPFHAENLHWIEGDILDISLLVQAMEEVEVVIHAAALVSFQPKDRDQLMKTNVEGTANVVNAALATKKVQKLIHISSVATLSPSKPMPTEVNESQGFNPDSDTSDYANSKFLAELEVARGVEEGLPAVLLNPSIILGRGTQGSAQLVNYTRKSPVFYPSGWLNYVDVRDVAKLTVYLVDKGPKAGEKIIASAGCIPYKEFFQKTASLQQKPAPNLEAGRFLSQLAWRVEAVKSIFTQSEPMLTRFTARSSTRKLRYRGVALEGVWPEFRYRSLEETLHWINTETA